MWNIYVKKERKKKLKREKHVKDIPNNFQYEIHEGSCCIKMLNKTKI